MPHVYYLLLYFIPMEIEKGAIDTIITYLIFGPTKS